MIMKRMIGLAVLTMALGTTALAAPPELVGTFAGSAKIRKFGVSGKTSVKLDAELAIGADNSTTLTLNGVVQLAALGPVITNTADVAFLYVDPINPGGSLNVVTLNVKKTTLSGTSTGLVIAPGSPPVLVSADEGKWKLKKQP
jgi:hypothetical protein